MTTNHIPNRLIVEKSPYLLQHAHNPVGWFPWSEEAFDKAKQENKPVFLSIDYSLLLTHTYLSLMGCSRGSVKYFV
ncbi:Highly conserved protein containing a thioredoxin domain [Paenibacillus uliginis N3/975]|uniref:Highly conserved protein containing a thioredoxin domain n=1 Tax=Paenibacillus uliginis N3/975 TaxID=1313296 RepID=A0A1X7HI41_9BACL|nr:DUF255 domain-containing protein [Paenibacillus uliginis]SMF86565.1 Highly conserved protein containing a thioredoxin domain [Paenibacillus uliginis N3/975]